MTEQDNLPQCNFEEINRARNDSNVLVIDVREVTELREVGHIPGAINIPLNEVATALGPEISEEDFKLKYSTFKPNKTVPIIFTCRSGRRSTISQQKALNLGYTNVKNYTGGWLDWEKQIKKTYQIS